MVCAVSWKITCFSSGWMPGFMGAADQKRAGFRHLINSFGVIPPTGLILYAWIRRTRPFSWCLHLVDRNSAASSSSIG